MESGSHSRGTPGVLLEIRRVNGTGPDPVTGKVVGFHRVGNAGARANLRRLLHAFFTTEFSHQLCFKNCRCLCDFAEMALRLRCYIRNCLLWVFSNLGTTPTHERYVVTFSHSTAEQFGGGDSPWRPISFGTLALLAGA
jgi:hypothetical protein